MGKTYDHIPEDLINWAGKQELFWVATAPLAAGGHVNVSPKGVRGTFRVVDKNTVWYEDLTGSGVETIAHLRENGRITILFIAFDSPARILRLFGTGTVHEFGTPEYTARLPPSARMPGSRGIISIAVHRVSTVRRSARPTASSCGWGVPKYAYAGPRNTLTGWLGGLERKRGLVDYWRAANTASVDGLPGLAHALACDAVPASEYRAGANEAPRASVLPVTAVVRAAVPRSGEAARLVLVFLLGMLVMDLQQRFAPQVLRAAGWAR
ncbi:hypothetical protein BC834DRAFT_833688 [Gloeopeniophorella convolvens]|nr:hypothetical protein BC834DRAFT_833688 [Gloeopeniophorella convolvens]